MQLQFTENTGDRYNHSYHPQRYSRHLEGAVLLYIQSSVACSSLTDRSILELEKPHSFGEVTPDTAPTIFKGPTRKHKDLVIKKA